MSLISTSHPQVVSVPAGNDWLIQAKSFPGTDQLHTVRGGISYSIDYGRLLIEWAIIASVYAAGAVALRAPAAAPKP